MWVKNTITTKTAMRKELVHSPILECVDHRKNKMWKGTAVKLRLLIQGTHALLDEAKHNFNGIKKGAVCWQE